MKTLWCSLTVLLLLAFSFTMGCSKKIEVDTVNLEYSFQTADDKTQETVTEAIEAIDQGQYSAALEKLKTVATDPNLTPEQKTNVTSVIAQLE